jgi:Flp pilus assembly pilin Flp
MSEPVLIKNPSEEGQAIVEYILMLVVVMSVVTILAVGFRKSIYSIWNLISRDVAAACPKDCPSGLPPLQ